MIMEPRSAWSWDRVGGFADEAISVAVALATGGAAGWGVGFRKKRAASSDEGEGGKEAGGVETWKERGGGREGEGCCRAGRVEW